MVEALEQQYDAFERAEETGEQPARRRPAAADRRGDRPAVRAVPRRARRPRRDRARRRPHDREPRPARSSPRPADAVSSSSCSTSRTSTSTCSAGSSPTPTGSGSSAARWPRRRWWPGVRTVDPAYGVHSLHSYFLLPGDTSVPIVYDVERIRDGRSFATRRVVARQHGRPIYYQTANFQRAEDGLEHQDAMPEVPAPEEGLDLVDADARPRRRRGRGAGQGVGRARRALPRQLAARPARGPAAPGAGPDVDPGQRGASATTRSSTWRRSPTPAT